MICLLKQKSHGRKAPSMEAAQDRGLLGIINEQVALELPEASM